MQNRCPVSLAIDVKGLVKDFGKTRALDGVDLQIKKGTVYGILGPNGAGKTTTVRVLTTLIRPTEGSASVLGHDVVKEAKTVRKHIGLTGQFASVDEEMTGIENLVLVGRLLGLSKKAARARAQELMDGFDLKEAANRLASTYSGGMRRRLDIAASLIVTPEILFLDEPTTGLDPRSRNQVWDMVRAIANAGTTVVLTTQYLEEADRLADRLAVIDHGRVIAEGTSQELKASVGSNAFTVRLRHKSKRKEAEQILTARFKSEFRQGEDESELTGAADQAKVGTALNDLRKAGIEVTEFSMGSPSLDEVFFALTGKPAETTEAAA
ncbi:MAG: ATP-binding cassette domain-containing protein [Thermoplasmatota archaeon]